VLDAPGDGMVSLRGTVAEHVFVGTATQVIVELDGGMRLVALAPEGREIGERVTVSWRPEHSRVLR
jgi:hypothetical protein